MAATYFGQVRDGVIVFDDGTTPLPEGARVRVQPEAEFSTETPSLADRLRTVIGKAKGLPSDLAENHDHYLHGLPKR